MSLYKIKFQLQVYGIQLKAGFCMALKPWSFPGFSRNEPGLKPVIYMGKKYYYLT